MEKGGLNIEIVHVCFGSLLMEDASRCGRCDKTVGFLHIAHRRTAPTREFNRCTTASFVSNPK